MKKYLYLRFTVLLFIVASIAETGCSKDEFDSEDYTQSLLSGEYGKGKYWNLTTILNGDTIQTDGFVRFESKDLKNANFWFFDVIPGESNKAFKNVELSNAEIGCSFIIDYPRKSDNIHISGTVTLGEMTVNMTMSE